MFVHRPFLSILTGLCVIGVVCFYIIVCWQSYSNKPSAAEVRTRKAARARKRKEELAKREEEAIRRRIEAKEIAVAKSRDGMRLKRRGNNSESEVIQNGIDSDSASEETGDSDINSASGEDSQAER